DLKHPALHLPHVLRRVVPSCGNPTDLYAPVRLPAVIPVVCTETVCQWQENDPVEVLDFKEQSGLPLDPFLESINRGSLQPETVHNPVQRVEIHLIGEILGLD